ncbi:BQ5605_C030g10852 [Microbotryum silenes-dioicae]|uniref:BQ5605_C030g10852 protein n=1 Tax=Microbotryum silenes-dioicae TaxID=796604 RepID=A0A2X0MI97_9BASI|nr:BQ5605_C030g10852 [Microbotryum silenes-dioicae]
MPPRPRRLILGSITSSPSFLVTSTDIQELEAGKHDVIQGYTAYLAFVDDRARTDA